MNCKFCGQPLEEGKRFCTNCGSPIMDTAPASPQPSTQTNKPPFSGPMSASPTPAAFPKKNGISKEKTVLFWASKALFIVALLLFFMPFIKIGHNESTMAGKDSKPLIVLTGKEMIVGIDDDNSAKDKSKSDFQNIRIITAAILLGVSIFMTQGAGITSAISAGLLFFYMRGAENSYKYGNKTIKEWDGLLKIHFQPALYAVLILAIVGAVLAGIDQVKRRKMFQQEQEFSPFGGYM